MKYNNLLALVLISIFLGNIMYVLFATEKSFDQKVTTSAVGQVGIVVNGTSEETQPSSGTATAAGGGGGGAPEEKISLITKSTDLIKVSLKIGSSFGTEIRIKNIGNTPLILSLHSEDFKQIDSNGPVKIISQDKLLVTLAPQTIKLNPNEEKTIKVNLETSEDIYPGLYVGKIFIEGSNIKDFITVMVEVESKKVFFDASLEIPAKYRQVLPGSEIRINPTIFNLADIPEADVELNYIITDYGGNIIFKDNEMIHILKQVTFSKTIKLPEDIKEGNYIITLYVKYKDSLAVSSNTFEVIKKEEEKKDYNYIFTGALLSIIIILIGLILYVQHTRIKTIHKTIRKTIIKNPVRYTAEDFANFESEKSKLFNQLDVLRKSYSEGFISKNAYIHSKNKLNELIYKIEHERKFKQ